MKPLKALNDSTATSSRDHTKGGYPLSALEDRLSDCVGQPDWRERADKAHAYYDMGKQLTMEQEHKIRRDWGIDPRQTNLIHGVINGVLGQEAKSRSDVRVESDDDDFADWSDVASMRMKEATREANIDMAVSNAYAGQVKGGIGWVEVSRASDPLDYPYRVQEVHRNEIWYDWRSKHLGLDDATWLIRKRWEDLDESIAMLPQFKEILTQAVNGWDLMNLPDDENSVLRSAWSNERRTRIVRDEWCDTRRKRVKFFEVWYRVPAEAVVLQLSPTKRVVYDEANPLHVQAVSRGLVKVSKATTRQIRMALFAGPHRLIDVGTTRRNFPYVPFFAFRDDEDRSPYGMIEGMISPQDEYNERRQMVNWMLKARQVQFDSDALDEKFNTPRDIERGAMRPDLMIVTNPARMNRNQQAVKIGNDLSFQSEQFEVMQDAKQLIQDVPKVFGSQLGNAPAGVTSGIANSLLIEQGIVAMGELNDNYRYGRKRVYEQVLDLVVEDHLEEDMRVMIGSGSQRRVIVLNTWGQNGEPINRVKDSPVRVGLSDVPTSPAFRQQEQQQVATMIQALGTNPAALNILAPVYIEGSSVPNRQAIADDLRRATGVPVSGDREAQAKAQQIAQQTAEQTRLLNEAHAKVEIGKTVADARLANAKAAELETGQHLALRNQQLGEVQTVMAANAAQAAPPSEEQLIQQALAEAMGLGQQQGMPPGMPPPNAQPPQQLAA